MTLGLGALCFIPVSCAKGPTSPPTNGPTRRDYSFTVDTIAYPGSSSTQMACLSGSSARDVWAVGANANGFANMYHFDGLKWSEVTALPPLSFSVSYSSVISFASNNVFAVGTKLYIAQTQPPSFSDSSLILHFDGSSWQVLDVPSGRGLLTISGTAASDIWAGGYGGTVYHFDGITWSRVPFDTTQILVRVFGTGTGEMYALTSYFNGLSGIDTAHCSVYHFRNSEWTRMSSMDFTNPLNTYGFGHLALWGSDPSNLYSVDAKVYRLAGSSWTFLFGENNLFYDVRGSANNNVFVVGDHGLVYQFNGTDWGEIKDFNATLVRFVSVLPFNGEVFILANYNNQSYVVHGILR